MFKERLGGDGRNAGIERSLEEGKYAAHRITGADLVTSCYSAYLLFQAVVLPVRFPSLYSGNRKPITRILLYGSPGTGTSQFLHFHLISHTRANNKTTGKSFAAQVVDKEAGCVFFSIKASTIGSKWKGDSENVVKNLFVMARECPRAIIFIDEIDAICGKREWLYAPDVM